MECNQLAVVAGCVRHADGTNTPVTIHYEYRNAPSGNVELHATRVTDAEGVVVALGPTDVLAVGACPIDRVSLFSFVRLVGVVGEVVVPVGTRSMTVFNNTSATLSLTLTNAVQALPPFSVHNIALDPDSENPLTGPAVVAVLGGNVEATEEIIINFKTVV